MTTPIPKFLFKQGSTPLLVSMPHVGTHIPSDIAAGMTEAALRLPDTDWHLPLLYDFLERIGASVLTATHSRYVVDLNRPADDTNLYPGQDTTGLCPLDTFHKEALYKPGSAPDSAGIAQRAAAYWQPYHAALAAELQRLRGEYGIAMLWDAHSICSVLPRFFEGSLPDLNFGTASGASCHSSLADSLLAIASRTPGYSAVLNGRFKGGYITRRYGDPAHGIHAVQLEMAQATYMDESFPYAFDEGRAKKIRPALEDFLEEMLAWADKHGESGQGA